MVIELRKAKHSLDGFGSMSDTQRYTLLSERISCVVRNFEVKVSAAVLSNALRCFLASTYLENESLCLCVYCPCCKDVKDELVDHVSTKGSNLG